MSREFPFPIPSGWFPVSASAGIAPGEVRRLECFGRELVLCRTDAGVAQRIGSSKAFYASGKKHYVK